MKQLLIIIILFFSLIMPLHSFGGREKSTPKTDFKKASGLWEKKGTDTYTVEILYKRGNFPDSEITIMVSPGELIWETENNEQLSEEFVSSITIEGLFEKVEKSLEGKEKSPFVLVPEYDSSCGFVRILSRLPSEEVLNSGRVPGDAGYRIEITKYLPGE